jgi:hypothetical protein
MLAGLRKNPYPMVNPRQEMKWQRARRREILGFIRKHYGQRAAETAANFPMFTEH